MSARGHTAYSVAEKLLHTATNLLVFAAIARALGADGFGRLGLVQAIFFVGLPLATITGDQVLIRFLVGGRHVPGTVLAQALALKLGLSAAVYAASVAGAALAFGREVATWVAIYALIHLVNVDLIFTSWFRAKEAGRTIFGLRNAVTVPFAAIKIATAFLTGDVALIAWAFVAEAVAHASVFALAARRRRIAVGPAGTSAELRELLGSAAPIAFATLLIVLYARIDQLMIGSMLDDAALGHYTAAVKVGEASTYVLTSYMLARFPALLRERAASEADYRRRIVLTIRQSVGFAALAFALALPLSGPALSLAFGPDFDPARGPLLIYLAGTAFIYSGILSTQWLVAEGLERFRILRVSLGLAANVVLNALWIPRYGIEGAAWASLVAQLLSGFALNALHPRTHPFFRLQCLALVPRRLTDAELLR